MSRIKLFKNGFTMAEVLITLGVVGVVAAMTLPSVINHYKKTVTEKQLKLAYNLVANGFKLSAFHNGPINDINFDNTNNEFFLKYIKPYFQGAIQCANMQECGYKTIPYTQWCGGDNYAMISNPNRSFFKIKNGYIILLLLTSQYVFIDINGSSGPNKSGADVFRFSINDSNGIYPVKANCTNKVTSGCAYYIMQNGWKIPDDYPVKL